MQEDTQAESQSAMTARDETGQFYGTSYQMHARSIITTVVILFTECPSGHKSFIGNVS